MARIIPLYAFLAALTVLPCTLAEPKVFGMKFTKVKKEVPQAGLQRRANTVYESLFNGGSLYIANISIGSPPQSMSVQLDTGSSDLWVPATSSNICARPNCKVWGSFNEQRSDTFGPLQSFGPFQIAYGDGSQYEGEYFSDTLIVGEGTLENMTMALAQSGYNLVGNGDAEDNNGLMGIGFDSNQARVGNEGERPYRGVVTQMKRQGLIKTQSYSLWLDDADSQTGSILFGGVDTSKYIDPLIALPIVGFDADEDYENVNEMAVEMTSLELTTKSGTTSLSSSDMVVPALLDSGTTSIRLPLDLAQAVWSAAGAVNDPNLGVPVVSCNLSTANASYIFGFGGASGPKVTVPLAELVRDFPSNPREQIHFADGTAACILGVLEEDDGRIILGDSFLRSAYVVYHLEAKIIALANSNINAVNTDGGSGSGVQEITDDTIPGIKGKVLPSQTLNVPIPSITAAPTTEVYDLFPYETTTYASFDGTLTENPGKASFTAESAVAGATGGSSPGKENGVARNVVGWEAMAGAGIVSLMSVLGGGTVLWRA